MIRAIVAVDAGGGIGVNGALPWGRSLKGDLLRFKALTLGQTVVMGHRTGVKVPDLPGRHVVKIRDAYKLRELCDQAIETGRDLWIAGGATVYRWALEIGLVDEWQVTRVDQIYPCDAHLVPFEREYHMTTKVRGADPLTTWEVWTK